LNVATLAKKWGVTLNSSSGRALLNPIVADGQVFLTQALSSSGSLTSVDIYALNATTGTTNWFDSISSLYGQAGLAYDGHTLFFLNFGGVLTAINADTGRENWSVQMPGQYAFTAQPTAYDGMVYVSGAGSGGTVYGVTEASGVVDWTGAVMNGDDSSPAVDDTGVYVSYACQQDYRFTINGKLTWHVSGNCEGGGGSTVALEGGYAYARGSAIDTPEILSALTGSQVGSFASDTIPAFGQGNMYTLQSGNLVAANPAGTPNRWGYGAGTLATPPVADSSYVFVGSNSGTIFGLSGSGSQVWSGSAGTTIAYGQTLALGDGIVVAPAGNTITAFGS
jgi:outer membrane protein assembly factor BamB